MKRSILIPGLLGISLLIVALLFRLLQYPNQILFILAGSAALFIAGHISYILVRVRRNGRRPAMIFEWIGFLLMLLLIVILFWYFYSHLNKLLLIPWAVLLAGGLTVYLYPAIRKRSREYVPDILFTGLYVSGMLLLWLTNPIQFQLPDKFYDPPIENPAYHVGEGPVILIDEGHHNFHTMSGRYYAFARVLQKDGYRVRPHSGPVSAGSLEGCKILVISNALNEKNVVNWYNPIFPAFTESESNLLEKWVASGGSLFLIADHMPMAGAVSGIAERFGFTLHNGFNVDSQRGPDLFCFSDSTLVPGPMLNIPDGRKIDSIVTFTGHGFEYPPHAVPVLVFRKGTVIMMPDTAWVFRQDTPRLDAEGMAQLAYMEHGAGRIVVSGEAAMFTSQCFGGLSWRKGGMGSAAARNNYRLLLNIIHWLDGTQTDLPAN